MRRQTALYPLQGLILVLALLWAAAALAQTPPDYDEWSALAARAEGALESGEASDRALETLRSELATWRQTFLDVQGQNTARIKTLEAQITALGKPPDDENGEPPQSPELAARRSELNEQLARLKAPALAAEEAYRHADGLIGEIDELIRSRRTDRLMQHGSIPLSPATWRAALNELGRTSAEIRSEIGSAVASTLNQQELRNNLPLVLILLGPGLILILRGRHWAAGVVNLLNLGASRGRGIWSFVISLGQILLPLLGLTLILQAIQATGMTGFRVDQILDRLPTWGGTILLVRWVGDRVFSRNDHIATIPIEPDRRAVARLMTTGLGLCIALHDFVRTISLIGNYTESTYRALDFPILALTGFLLFRLGRILAGLRGGEDTETESESGFARSTAWIIARVTIAIGILAPLLAVIGYGAAGTALGYPAAGSLVLIGLITVLQRLIFDIYDFVTGTGGSDQRGLIPVLLGFCLSLAGVPLLALIWGARQADLTELWTRFQEGFAIGENRISPGDFLTFVVVFVIGFMMTRLVQGALRSSVLPKTRIGAGGQTAILSGLGYVGIFLSALIAITSAGVDLTAFGYVAGALSVGIGFGLQNIVSNFVSGIILLIERPISKGDWIEVGGQMGYVRDISVRATRIETFDRTDVIVPNSDFISGTVTNYTRGNTIGRVIAPVGVAYGTDTEKVTDILMEIAKDHPMVLASPPPNVVFRGFGADSLDFEIRAILRDVNFVLNVHSDMNHSIAKRFAEEGIEIPFAQRDVWLRNPEALTAPAGSKDET